MNLHVTRAVAGVALVAAASLLAAGEPAPSQSKADVSTKSAAFAPANSAGMRVYLDPETGALVDRPVTEQQKRAAESDAALFSQDNSGLKVVTHPDGSRSIDLEGRFEMASQAHKTADGTVGFTCTQVEHGDQGVHTHAPATPTPDVR